MFYDDLPIWGFIGKIAKEATGAMNYLLYRHVHFDIHYNKDKVVEINVSTDPLQTVDISDDEPVEVSTTSSVPRFCCVSIKLLRVSAFLIVNVQGFGNGYLSEQKKGSFFVNMRSKGRA